MTWYGKIHGVKRKPVLGEAEPSQIRVFFSHHVFFRIRSLTYYVTNNVRSWTDLIRKNTWCEKKTRIGRGGAEPDTGFLFTPCIFPYQVANLLCNEFITSKTFLLEFANYKTFINNKAFVGPLTHVWRENVTLWRALFLLCDVTAISRQRHPRCCYANVKLQQKGCFNALYFLSC